MEQSGERKYVKNDINGCCESLDSSRIGKGNCNSERGELLTLIIKNSFWEICFGVTARVRVAFEWQQIWTVKVQMSTWVKSTKVESHNLHAHCICTMSIGHRNGYYGNPLLSFSPTLTFALWLRIFCTVLLKASPFEYKHLNGWWPLPNATHSSLEWLSRHTRETPLVIDLFDG